MKKLFLVFSLLLGFSLAVSVKAATVINDIGDPINITLNSGKLIRLESAANSVFVGNPDLADVQVQSPTIIYVFAKKPGKTNLFALNAKGQVLLNSPVTIRHDVNSLQDALADIDPNGLIKAHSMKEGIILTGRVPTSSMAEDARRLATLYAPEDKIVNRMVVEGAQQVNLRVRVAEVSRSVTKQLGVNWENLNSFGNFSIGNMNGPETILEDGTISWSSAVKNLFFGFNDGNVDINGMVQALEDDGLITVLAEPNLTALSGETASFLAGGEFPIPVPQDDGAITIEYKQFGVSLRFKPTLVGNNRINLKVRPEVSQLSSASAINVGGVFIQSLLTRRADTTVELASGQSFVLGGLLNSDSDNNVSRTPLLGELPIIGALFRSSAFQRNETELIIIVTPYLVKPTNSRIALPTDGYVPPNDRDLYGSGDTFRPTEESALPKEQNQDHSEMAKKSPDQQVKLIGPAGFIME